MGVFVCLFVTWKLCDKYAGKVPVRTDEPILFRVVCHCFSPALIVCWCVGAGLCADLPPTEVLPRVHLLSKLVSVKTV
jgi:hypothetical protein